MPATERFKFAAFAVDRHTDVDFAFVALLGSLRERMLQCSEDHIFIDVLFARQRIDQ